MCLLVQKHVSELENIPHVCGLLLLSGQRSAQKHRVDTATKNTHACIAQLQVPQ